jgi:hypothetical protein
MRSVSALRNNKCDVSTAPSNADVIVVTRTTNQSETVTGFVALTGLNAVFLAGESFLDRGKNHRILAGIAKRYSNINVRPLPSRSLRLLLRDYFWAATKILTYTPPVFVFRGHDIVVKQSIKELLVMLPELIGYRRKLSEALASIPQPTWRLLMSLEQKSPHACIDANVARKDHLTCVHVMQSDQHARPLPWPVFGDYFLTDTESNAIKMREFAAESSDRIRYIGSFKACIPSSHDYRSGYDARIEKMRLCFFTHSDDIEANIIILEFLLNSIAKDQFAVTVKLHPRDNSFNYRAYRQFRIVADGEMERSAVFDTFDIAISFPSGVINELILRNKPLALLGFSAGRNATDYDYWDESYYGAVTSVDSLSEALENYQHLLQSFLYYRNAYLARTGVTSDLNMMRTALQSLAGTSNNH